MQQGPQVQRVFVRLAGGVRLVVRVLAERGVPLHTIAIVSHGDIIKGALAHYLGTPVDLFQRLWVAPGSWSIVDLPAGGMPQVIAVNRIASGNPA